MPPLTGWLSAPKTSFFKTGSPPANLAGYQEKPPEETIPRVEGGPFREWLRAIKGAGPEPGSNFSYSAKLTEIILLGVLAQRFNTRIEWDAKTARVTNHPELNAFVKEPVREGWACGEDL